MPQSSKPTATLLLVRRAAAALLLVGLLGCGSGAKTGNTSAPTDKDTAEDVARLLKDFGEAHKRPPAGIHELGDATATHPLGHGAVAGQLYVVYWKAPVQAGAGNTVLAYAKDVPTRGGTVVMQDGSVREMTAEEFKNAPKAGK